MTSKEQHKQYFDECGVAWTEPRMSCEWTLHVDVGRGLFVLGEGDYAAYVWGLASFTTRDFEQFKAEFRSLCNI